MNVIDPAESESVLKHPKNGDHTLDYSLDPKCRCSYLIRSYFPDSNALLEVGYSTRLKSFKVWSPAEASAFLAHFLTRCVIELQKCWQSNYHWTWILIESKPLVQILVEVAFSAKCVKTFSLEAVNRFRIKYTKYDGLCCRKNQSKSQEHSVCGTYFG